MQSIKLSELPPAICLKVYLTQQQLSSRLEVVKRSWNAQYKVHLNKVDEGLDKTVAPKSQASQDLCCTKLDER